MKEREIDPRARYIMSRRAAILQESDKLVAPVSSRRAHFKEAWDIAEAEYDALEETSPSKTIAYWEEIDRKNYENSLRNGFNAYVEYLTKLDKKRALYTLLTETEKIAKELHFDFLARNLNDTRYDMSWDND